MRVAFIVRMAPKTSSPDFFVCVDYDGIITHKSMYVFAEISLCHACRVPECQTCGYLAFVQNLRVRTALVSSPGDTGDRRGVFLVFFLLCMQLFCVFHCIFIYCRTDCKQTEMEPWMNDKRRDGKTKHKNEPINTNNHEKKKIMNRFWWAACMRGIFRCCCW